jgi:hypothetical protein
LIPRTFVDDVEHRLAVDIEYIDDNGVVEIDVVPQVKLETARGSTVFLALLTVFRQVFECLPVDVVTGPFEYVLQLSYRRVAKTTVETS